MTQTTKPARASWQQIRETVRQRIHSRDWPPGAPIPNEEVLAQEFGCARATVNRALRSLAEDGLVDRRRKGGTRVALHPVRRAVLEIAIMRQEVEETGAAYGYRLVQSGIVTPPDDVAARMRSSGPCLHVLALHHADGVSYAVEDRWIDACLTGLDAAPFDRVSPNEWLLEHIPYTGGALAFSAEPASAQIARLLDVTDASPVLCLDRSTQDGDRIITAVRLYYRAGHRFTSSL
ncbi:GntR family transcriptional regulator [Chachezhania sediminis]|uniref:GntR family transcriptional regulator n=1 Tax=Chachezhania sediminis TaxID=2599291 RepID=UPI00131CDCA6|nr:UTRA domain-containing protein [Chachezhania sediminis]